MPKYMIRSDSIDPEEVWIAPDNATAITWATETLVSSEAEPGEEIVLVRVDDDYRQAEEHIATLTMPPATDCPGYPGPCPDGMDWSEWLARNNVD